MRARALLVATAAFAMVPGVAAGQMTGWLDQLRLEVRGGLSIGSHSEAASALDLAPKPSFDLLVRKDVIPTVSVFGGYYRTTFGCLEGFCTDRDITIVANHGAVGAQWVPDLPQLLLGPWLRGGLLVGSTRAGTEGADPNIGFGLGFGVGLQSQMGPMLFRPGMSYRYLTANTAANSAYAIALSFHIGLEFALGGG